VFLTLAADRIAHGRGDAAWRVEFTTALANRLGEFLADNEADLLRVDTPGEASGASSRLSTRGRPITRNADGPTTGPIMRSCAASGIGSRK
jgi:hypothetical protein